MYGALPIDGMRAAGEAQAKREADARRRPNYSTMKAAYLGTQFLAYVPIGTSREEVWARYGEKAGRRLGEPCAGPKDIHFL